MKKNLLDYICNRLTTLYHKLQFRLNKSFASGRFGKLNRQQQYKLLRRLDKLKAQLIRLDSKLQYGSATLVITGLSLNPSIAQEAKPAGDEFRVNTHTAGTQRYQKIAMDKDGDFVVTWASRGQDAPSEYGIFAQCYNAKGEPTTTEFQVNTYTENRQTQPAIAMDDNGNFVIVWTSSGQDGSLGGVFGQRFAASGIALGSEFQVNIYTDGNQYSPSVAMDSDGDFVVAWSSSQDPQYGIFARQYNASGEAVSGELHVNTQTAGVQRFPSVAMDDEGDFVVTWQSDDQDGSSYGIYGQRYNASGLKQGTEFQVNTYAQGAQKTTVVAMDSDGDFVVAWQSPQDGSGDGIYAQRYNASGVPVDDEFQVNTHTSGTQSTPSVHMNSAGDFIIAWSSPALDNNGGISAQRYNAAGKPEGTEFLVNTYTSGSQTSPSVAIADNKNFVITWSSDGQDGSGFGIYAQRYAVNQPPTDIALSSLSADENAAAGTAIATLAATDPDADDSFTYALVTGEGAEDNSDYTIAGDQLLINESPDFEVKSSYSIRVSATDQEGLSVEKAFVITINDVNEAPSDILLNTDSVDEKIPADSEVGLFSAIDPDASDSFTYTLVTGEGDDDNASFSIAGDQLLINESPDFETKDSYSIRVSVTDQGGLSYEKVFVITVNDVIETGLTNINAFGASVRLYPNPARETIQIDLDGSIQIRIMDLSGSVLKQDLISNRTISIEGLSSGVYLLEFSQNDRTGVKKLVIE